jgi:adenine-specific DNA-methyltransferase
MRYLGSKDSLADHIVDLLRNKELLQHEFTFFDGLCGMGSISDAVKTIYKKIIINDSLNCASVFTHAKLIANGCTFEKLGFDPFNYLNTSDGFEEGFIFKNYSLGASDRMCFSKENAGRIDFFREQIEKWYLSQRNSIRDFSYYRRLV